MGLSLAIAPFASAQPPVVVRVTKTTTTTGTISEFGPDRMVVRSETSPTPLHYTFTKSTTYVDETGAPVSIETVKSGLPVTVHFTRDGDRLLADKVVVQGPIVRVAPPPETRTTRTTTEEIGTVGEFGADAFTVRGEAAQAPVRYSYTKTTTYVDEDGNPVAVETVRSGVPVTVHYANEGERRVVSQVIVHKERPGLFERLRQKRNEERVREDAERLNRSEEKLRREKKD